MKPSQPAAQLKLPFETSPAPEAMHINFPLNTPVIPQYVSRRQRGAFWRYHTADMGTPATKPQTVRTAAAA